MLRAANSKQEREEEEKPNECLKIYIYLRAGQLTVTPTGTAHAVCKALLILIENKCSISCGGQRTVHRGRGRLAALQIQ